MGVYLRGKVYWTSYYDGKKQIRVSTHCTDRAEAVKMSRTLIAPTLLDHRADQLQRLYDRAQELHDEAKASRAAVMELDKLWQKLHFAGLRGTAKPGTIAKVQSIWETFARHARNAGLTTVSSLTPEYCRQYISKCKSRYAQQAWLYCRAILRLSGETRDLFGLKPRRETVIHREPLTPEQIAALFRQADTICSNPESRHIPDRYEFAQFVRFLVYTGLRLGDAATVTMTMIDRRENTLARVMAKTQRPVLLPLHPALLPMIDAADDGRNYLFPSLAASYLRSPAALTLRFERLFAAAGITGQPGEFCAHCLRTTFASICAEAGIPISVIQSWLGHTSSMVTRIYARIEDLRVKRDALTKFPTF